MKELDEMKREKKKKKAQNAIVASCVWLLLIGACWLRTESQACSCSLDEPKKKQESFCLHFFFYIKFNTFLKSNLKE